ncbi:DUF3293 domain-containing protein [Salinisphaera orenii]|uniref:DUF3293 domain-containing protein n=1 Tax=Salinisphaera orenii TaxID=856731 RepID=UPI0013A60509
MTSNELITAYEDTHYGVDAGAESFTFRVGERAPRLADFLSQYPGQGAVFITASNPHSQVASDQENRRANARLRAELDALGLVVMKGHGTSPDGAWREESQLAFPINRGTAKMLCGTYGQNAVVYIEANGVPELLWHPACFE